MPFLVGTKVTGFWALLWVWRRTTPTESQRQKKRVILPMVKRVPLPANFLARVIGATMFEGYGYAVRLAPENAFV